MTDKLFIILQLMLITLVVLTTLTLSVIIKKPVKKDTPPPEEKIVYVEVPEKKPATFEEEQAKVQKDVAKCLQDWQDMLGEDDING